MSQFQKVTPALEDSSDAAETPEIIQISAVLAPQINFACHQNALPLIRQLIIRNSTAQEHSDLRLTLTASPGFVASSSWQIDRLLAGGELVINERDVRLDGDYLMGLEEKQQGELYFSLTDAQGQQLAELSHPVEVLARSSTTLSALTNCLIVRLLSCRTGLANVTLPTDANDIARHHAEAEE